MGFRRCFNAFYYARDCNFSIGRFGESASCILFCEELDKIEASFEATQDADLRRMREYLERALPEDELDRITVRLIQVPQFFELMIPTFLATIESKWGNVGRFMHPVAEQPYGETWSFYRSPRRGHLIRLDDQLGLKLNSGRGEVPVLVVDYAARIPTRN